MFLKFWLSFINMEQEMVNIWIKLKHNPEIQSHNIRKEMCLLGLLIVTRKVTFLTKYACMVMGIC